MTKIVKMMKARPLNPTTFVPCRVQEPDGTYTTWYPDGYIKTIHSNGNFEVWMPAMFVEKPYMHQSVLPNGKMYTYYYTEEEHIIPVTGNILEHHYVDVDDGKQLCWENECTCYSEEDELNDAHAYSSYCEFEGNHVGDIDNCQECYEQLCNMQPETKTRCQSFGKHVGDPDCSVCGPEFDDEEETKGRYIDESEEFADY